MDVDEVWGTYSAHDHLQEHPWAADVMLYDRLLIPVPPARNSPQGPDEWMRWETQGWAPARQHELLMVLGKRAIPVAQDTFLWSQWADVQDDSLGLARQAELEYGQQRYTMTRMAFEPFRETTIIAVATYRSAANLTAAMKLSKLGEHDSLPTGRLTVIVGREFLALDPNAFRSDEDLLRAALLIENNDVQDRRAAYWRWQSEFLRSGLFVDQESVTAAVEQMQDLIADEQQAVRRSSRASLVTMFALAVFHVRERLLTRPLISVTSSRTFLSVGQFAVAQAFAASAEYLPSPLALLISDRKELGWH